MIAQRPPGTLHVLMLLIGLLSFVGCNRSSTESEIVSDSDSSAEMIAAPIDYAVATENRVRVRSEPTLESETLGHLYQGDLVAIFARTADEIIDEVSAPWYEIRTAAGLSGWAFGAFVELIDAETYSTRVRRLSVSTTNVPWEPGNVTEEAIRGAWGPEDGSFGWRVDFFPTDVSVIQGRPMKIEPVGEAGQPITARWRVRNGYLITEVESSAEPWPGFTIWDLQPTELSFFSLRSLAPLYRDSPFLFDGKAGVPAGEIRTISGIELTTLGLQSVVLQNRSEVFAAPSDDAERLRFTLRSGDSTESTKALPTGHTIRLLGASADGWIYIDTGLGWSDEGPKSGWMPADALDR